MMPNRKSRLQSKPKNGSRDSLRSAIKEELVGVSESRLQDYIKAKKSVIKLDPLLATYHELALMEKDRRKMLRKLWGKESPTLPYERIRSIIKAVR